jgi:hypothetical protein
LGEPGVHQDANPSTAPGADQPKPIGRAGQPSTTTVMFMVGWSRQVIW